MEILGLILGLCGFAGVVWIMIVAFQNGDIIWAILSFFCGIVAIVYAIQHFEQCKIPLGLVALGIVGGVLRGVAGAG